MAAQFKYTVCNKNGTPCFETSSKTEANDLLDHEPSVKGGYAEYDDGKPGRRNPAKRKRIPTGLDKDHEIVLFGEPVGPFQRSATVVKGEADPKRAEAITHVPSGASLYRAPPRVARVVFAALGRAYRALSPSDKALLNKKQKVGTRPAPAAMAILKRLYTEMTGAAVPKYGRGRRPVRGGIHIDDVKRKQRNPWVPTSSAPDLSRLEGPKRVTKAVASAARGLKVGATYYYDEQADAYYDPNREAWFSIAVSKRDKPSSAIAEARQAAENAAAEIQVEINNQERAVEARIRREVAQQGLTAGQRDKKMEAAKRADTHLKMLDRERGSLIEQIQELTPKRAPPEKRETHKAPPAVKRRIRQGSKKKTPMVFIELPEAQGRNEDAEGIARLYFDRHGPEGAFIEAILDHYVPKLKPRAETDKFGKPTPPELSPYRGAYGYWGVPLDDLPSVVERLAPRVEISGMWKLQLDKKMRTLDRKAETAKRKFAKGFNKDGGIAMPADVKLMVGTDPDTGKKMEIQKDGISFLMSRDRAVLADSMGLGKTLQAIVAAHNSVPANEQILVLCPAAVVGNWQKEVRWLAPGAPAVIVTNSVRVGGDDTIGTNFAVGKRYPDNKKTYGTLAGKLVDGEPSRRGSKARFIIASYQGAASRAGDAPLRKYLMGITWGCVILDEAHRLKKPETLGHKFVEKLKTHRLWALSGTIISNRPRDAFGILKLINHPLGSNIKRFMESFTPDRLGEGGDDAVVLDRQVLRKLGNAMSGAVLIRDKTAIADQLPKKIGTLGTREGMIHVDVPRNLQADPGRKAGDRETMRRKLAQAKAPASWDLAMRAVDDDGKVVLFTTYVDVMREFTELAIDNHLLAVEVSGSVSTQGKQVAVALFQGSPIKEKADLAYVRKKWGNHWLLWLDKVPYDEWSAADKARAKSDPVFGPNRKKWPPHRISVFIGQMVAASEGVTLTASDVLIVNDLDYMPSRHLQAEDRIWRKSRSASPFKNVYIAYMLSNTPLDTKLWDLLVEKKAEIEDVYGEIAPNADAAAARIRKEYAMRLKGAYGAALSQQVAARRQKKAAAKARRRK